MNEMRNILANCLREDANGYTVSALMAEFPTIIELMNASEDEIRLIKGIGAVKAKQLKAIMEFVKVANRPVGDKVTIHSPKDVYNLVRSEMEFLQVEQFVVVGLSTKNHMVCKETVSSGTLNASIVHPRETFRPLIKRACASCILIHNHPSGDTTPSEEDIVLTKKLMEAGILLGIQVLDHIIVGFGHYVSFKEKGVI